MLGYGDNPNFNKDYGDILSPSGSKNQVIRMSLNSTVTLQHYNSNSRQIVTFSAEVVEDPPF